MKKEKNKPCWCVYVCFPEIEIIGFCQTREDALKALGQLQIKREPSIVFLNQLLESFEAAWKNEA